MHFNSYTAAILNYKNNFRSYFSNAQDFEIRTETKTLNQSFLELRWEFEQGSQKSLGKCCTTTGLEIKEI